MLFKESSILLYKKRKMYNLLFKGETERMAVSYTGKGGGKYNRPAIREHISNNDDFSGLTSPT